MKRRHGCRQQTTIFFREFLEISDDPLILLDRNRKAHKLLAQTL